MYHHLCIYSENNQELLLNLAYENLQVITRKSALIRIINFETQYFRLGQRIVQIGQNWV